MSDKVILILDDDPQVRELISFWLTEAGYDLHVASEFGENTLKLGIENIVPDLVIVDLKLSENMLQGTDVIGELRREYPDLKIIAISGYHERGLAAIARGADVFIGKPFRTYRDLLDVVERLLNSGK